MMGLEPTKNRATQKHGAVKDKNKDLSRAELLAKRQTRKVERAMERETMVVSTKDTETQITVRLLENLDYYITSLRKNSIGHSARIQLTTVADFIERVKNAQQMINEINLDLAKVLHKHYNPPPGFKRLMRSRHDSQKESLELQSREGVNWIRRTEER